MSGLWEPGVLVGVCHKAGLVVLDVSVSPDGHTRAICERIKNDL